MIQIGSLPQDNFEWVVELRGAVRKNHLYNSNPLVEVLLTRINEAGEALAQTATVNITELDIVRIGSCWKNGFYIKTINTWWGNNLDQVNFEFDLEEHPPKIVEFGSRDPNNSAHYLIPPYLYRLPDESKNQAENYYYRKASYLRTKLNSLTSVDGTEVFISALETLTSLYTPSRKEIRRMILNRSIEKILDTFLDGHGYDEDTESYWVRPKDETHLGSVPIIFLAHLSENINVQTVIDQIHSTLEIVDLDPQGKPYQNRYPEILPYHSSTLKFTAQGIWLDDKKTRFLVLRVNSVVAPSEVKVIVKTLDKKPVSVSVDSQQLKTLQKTITQARETRVNTASDPGHEAGITYIMTEVESTIEDGVLSHTTEAVDIESQNVVTNVQTINQIREKIEASAGEAFGAKSRVKKLESKTKKESLNQLTVLRGVYSGLKALEANADSNIKKVECFDFNGTLTSEYNLINIYTLIKNSSYENASWVEKRGGRKILIIKITMSDGSFRYHIEIERQVKEDSHLGIYFTFQNTITSYIIKKISILCAQHIGRGNWLQGLSGVLMCEKFRHTPLSNNSEWTEKMRRLLSQEPKTN